MRKLNFIFILILFCTLNACKNTAYDNHGKAKMEFDEPTFDFGKVTVDKKVLHSFHFINTGNDSLVIESIITSCGCTVGEYTKGKLPPGGKGEIIVTFDTHNKLGFQHKLVTVKSNSNPTSQSLSILAVVIH